MGEGIDAREVNHLQIRDAVGLECRVELGYRIEIHRSADRLFRAVAGQLTRDQSSDQVGEGRRADRRIERCAAINPEQRDIRVNAKLLVERRNSKLVADETVGYSFLQISGISDRDWHRR